MEFPTLTWHKQTGAPSTTGKTAFRRPTTRTSWHKTPSPQTGSECREHFATNAVDTTNRCDLQSKKVTLPTDKQSLSRSPQELLNIKASTCNPEDKVHFYISNSKHVNQLPQISMQKLFPEELGILRKTVGTNLVDLLLVAQEVVGQQKSTK